MYTVRIEDRDLTFKSFEMESRKLLTKLSTNRKDLTEKRISELSSATSVSVRAIGTFTKEVTFTFGDKELPLRV